MRSSRALIIVLLSLACPRLWGGIRAEFTTSHPDRWLEPTVISRTAPDYPSTAALHAIQRRCNGFDDIIYNDFAASYWITPPTPAGPIVFVMDSVDPLEIVDFHVSVGACLDSGVVDYSNPLVTATLRLFEDGVLISERQVQTRNCIPSADTPFGCALGWAALPVIGTYPPDATPPKITFAPDAGFTPSHRRIMNRAQALGGYPSPYQERLVGAASVADVGGMIEVEVTLTGVDGGPAADTDVYVTVVDPPDPAPYRSDRRTGDNRDTVTPFVSGPPGYEVQIPGSTGTVLRTDAAGKTYARLHGSTREAGDNYRLRVSLYRAVPASEECSPNKMIAPCFESGVFTIWKRAVIENDRMIRAGAFMAQTYDGGGAQGGGTQIRVVRTKGFKPAAGSTLIFMHAGSGPGTGSSEIRSIVSYKNGVITLAQPLTGRYEGPGPDGGVHTADAVGVWGSGFYDLSLDPLSDVFFDTFIDVHELPQPMPYFPYVDKMKNAAMRDLAGRWREGQANVHLVGARYYFGESFGSQEQEFSYVWVQQCIDYTSTTDPLRNEIAAHEVVHRWRVNTAAGRSTDHCDLNAYANAAHRCSMHTYIQQGAPPPGSPVRVEFRDGIVQFHYVVSGGTADSEYLGLRSKDGVQ